MKGLIILGAGGMAREIYYYLLQSGVKNYSHIPKIVFYDDTSSEDVFVMCGVERDRYVEHPLINEPDKLSDYNGYQFLVGVGSPVVKKVLVKKALYHGLKPAKTLITEQVYIADAKIGRGGIITPGVKITTNIKIGNYVVLNWNTTIGHDAVIEDYVTINPGCHISGNVVVGEGSMLGTGTVIKEKTTIAPNTIIGAQGCVVKHITEPGVYVGVPVEKIK